VNKNITNVAINWWNFLLRK